MTDSREWLLDELDGDMRNPGVGTSGRFRYTRDLPGSPGTHDESVLYLRILYAWLPVLKDAGHHVPKLKTWDADWGGDSALTEAERAMTGQLENASPGQIASYKAAYLSRKSGMRGAMGMAEEKFVTQHLSTPWKKSEPSKAQGSKHERGENPRVKKGRRREVAVFKAKSPSKAKAAAAQLRKAGHNSYVVGNYGRKTLVVDMTGGRRTPGNPGAVDAALRAKIRSLVGKK